MFGVDRIGSDRVPGRIAVFVGSVPSVDCVYCVTRSERPNSALQRPPGSGSGSLRWVLLLTGVISLSCAAVFGVEHRVSESRDEALEAQAPVPRRDPPQTLQNPRGDIALLRAAPPALDLRQLDETPSSVVEDVE